MTMVKENIGQAGGVEAGSGGHVRGVRGGHLTHSQQEPERLPGKGFMILFCI